MASLKEVKNRISSVGNTRKITSAMKMVASSKLHRAGRAIEGMRPYEAHLSGIMSTFAATLDGEVTSPYVVRRPVKRSAIVVITSNSSLCGAFNNNVVKALRRQVEAYENAHVAVTHCMAIGKKGEDAAKAMGLPLCGDLNRLTDHPSYPPIAAISEQLLQAYAKEEIDEVRLIYHHFKNNSCQILTEETFLPVSLPGTHGAATPTAVEETTRFRPDYIIEPSKEELLTTLIPKLLHLKLFSALLDSIASEHAARMIAMQVATDNADDLLHELTLTYNKTRQQAITNELLDIVAGSMK